MRKKSMRKNSMNLTRCAEGEYVCVPVTDRAVRGGLAVFPSSQLAALTVVKNQRVFILIRH